MEHLYVKNASNIQACAEKAAKVLRGGGIILYPTDTLYGLGADALSDTAVDKVYAIKVREERKPIHAIVSDIKMAERHAHINENAHLLAKAFLPGALTLILKKQKGFKTGIGRRMETIGIRMPDDQFCLALAHTFGRPYTTTSANKSGLKPQCTVEEILKQLGKFASLIDLIIDAGELPTRLPSTVVDVSEAHPIIVREGAIPSADIWTILREEQ